MRLNRRMTLNGRHVASFDDHVRLGEPLLGIASLVLDGWHRRRLRPREPGDSAIVDGAIVDLEVSFSVGMSIVHVEHDSNQIHRPLRRVLIVGRYGCNRVADVAGATVHEEAIASNGGTLAGVVDLAIPGDIAKRDHPAVAGQGASGAVVDLLDVSQGVR